MQKSAPEKITSANTHYLKRYCINIDCNDIEATNNFAYLVSKITLLTSMEAEINAYVNA